MLVMLETPHLYDTAPSRKFGWLIPVVVGLLIATSVIAMVVTRYPTFDFLSELTVYRIGNAISLLFGEKEYIHPVQGLPIAILSKLEIWIMGLVRSTYVMDARALAIYQAVYFATLFAAVTASLATFWEAFSPVQRSAALLFIVSPWLLGGPSLDLLIEPDYWAGEWCYLAMSLAALAAVRLHRDRSSTPALVGAWLAVGVAMKVTLLGIAPLFLLALDDRRPRRLAIIAVSFTVGYVAIAAAYMGGFQSTIKLLAFQARFFVHPNNQVEWPSVVNELAGRPFFIALLLATVVALASSTERLLARIAAIAWAALIGYLLWRRPHETSVASAATVLTFLAAYFIRTRAALIVVCVLLFGGAGADQHFERMRYETNILLHGWGGVYPAGMPKIDGMLFLPDNYWNAALAPQAFGYNGELGFYYPVTSAADGTPRYAQGGKAFQALFPGVVILSGNAASLDAAEKGLAAGVPIWWTRTDPIPASSAPGMWQALEGVIARSGASLTTFRFQANGADWLLQKAHVEP